MHDIIHNFLSGASSGIISSFLFQPFDVLKTQIQNQKQLKGTTKIGYATITKNILQTDGVLGFWKGLSPTLVRCIPGVGLYFTVISVLSEHLVSENPTVLQSLVIGGTARTCSTVCFIPFTILKTRFESDKYHYDGILHAFKDIKRNEGLRGFFRGLLPTIIRDVPFSGIYYMCYVRIKILFGVTELTNSSSRVFLSGVMAGCLASLITHPADLIKTYMQLYPKEFGKVSSGILTIHKKFGMLGYFNGLLVRLIRRTLISSMSWTVYEKVNLKKNEIN